MAPCNQYSEEKNIMICGPPKSGRTSLGFTLCRGIFPSVPCGRFEGWALEACAVPSDSGSLEQRSRAGSKQSRYAYSTSSKDVNHNGQKAKPYFVTFTFWEDRPRREDEANEMRRRAEDTERDCGNGSVAGSEGGSSNRDSNPVKENLNGEAPAENGSVERANEADRVYVGQKHHFNKREEEEPCPVEQPKPKRIWPMPKPDILLVCYSSVDFVSYHHCETDVLPEIVEQFPGVPIVLVATKCDSTDELANHETTVKLEVEGGISAVRKSLHGVVEKHEASPQNMADDGEPKCWLSPIPGVVSSEMGQHLAQAVGAKAFIEVSAKDRSGLQSIMEEAVWISFDDWVAQNSSGSHSDNSPNSPVSSRPSAAAVSPSHWQQPHLAAAGKSSSTPSLPTSSSSVFHPRQTHHRIPRPIISVQEPSSNASPSLPNSLASLKQHKLSYRRSTIKKIWHSYYGGSSSGK